MLYPLSYGGLRNGVNLSADGTAEAYQHPAEPMTRRGTRLRGYRLRP